MTLGDYIDRGPDSRGVIDRLAQNPFPTPYVALKGNHEGMLIDFLDDPELGMHWRMQGGEQTLQSYGVAVRPLMVGKNNAEAAARLHDALPASHLAFLELARDLVSARPLFPVPCRRAAGRAARRADGA